MKYRMFWMNKFRGVSGPSLLYVMGLVAFIFITSCEDVVDIETADAPSQLVVDAWLTDEDKPQTIRLTRSQPYFNSEFAQAMEGATVEVLRNNNTTIIFADQGAGNYTWTPTEEERIGNIGDRYILQISTADIPIISAEATMNPSPKIDSIKVIFRENDLRGPDGLYAEFFARDLPGFGNTYWIKAFKNYEYLNKPDEINLAYDAGFDAGAEIDNLIFIPPIREQVNPVPDSADADLPPFVEGDLLRVEIHSLTLEAFEFMSTVRDEILNGTNTIFATPIANAQGNIQSTSGEKILGVFNVANVTRLDKRIE
ncbi:MAG: DUF4249 domain-containing protein [Saprospiraceae bacterium]|nr:DUF4249 domain-containing protein [Saprospiraceae bacterium]